MAENPNSVNDRLEQSSNGTPKINPDEQRKYLGTFRERVSLVIPIKDMDNPKALQAFKLDIQKHPNETAFMNGNIDQDLIGKYMGVASQNNVKFDLETDSFYFTKPDSYGVVFANPTEAINEYPIMWNAKYPKLDNQSANKRTEQKPKHHVSLKDKIKHFFKD